MKASNSASSPSSAAGVPNAMQVFQNAAAGQPAGGGPVTGSQIDDVMAGYPPLPDMTESAGPSSPSSAADGLNAMQVFQNAAAGQLANDGPMIGDGFDDAMSAYPPLGDTVTAADMRDPASGQYPLAIQGLLGDGVSAQPYTDALSQLNFEPAPPQPDSSPSLSDAIAAPDMRDPANDDYPLAIQGLLGDGLSAQPYTDALSELSLNTTPPEPQPAPPAQGAPGAPALPTPGPFVATAPSDDAGSLPDAGLAGKAPASADNWLSTIGRVAAQETGDSGYAYADGPGAATSAPVEQAGYKAGEPSGTLPPAELARLYDGARATRDEFDTIQANRKKAGQSPYDIGILGGLAGFLMNIGHDRPALDVKNDADVRPFMEDLAALRVAKGLHYPVDGVVLGNKAARQTVGTPVGAAAPALAMSVSAKGRDFIKSYEQGPNGGPALMPYPSPEGGADTIGWGHKIKAGEDFSGGITRPRADDLFSKDLAAHTKLVTNNIHVPLTQNQFDALVAMGYNVPSAFIKPAPPKLPSTLRDDLNAGNYQGAADQLPRWDWGGRPPRIMRGLKDRRAAERNLFLNGIYTNHSVNGH